MLSYAPVNSEMSHVNTRRQTLHFIEDDSDETVPMTVMQLDGQEDFQLASSSDVGAHHRNDDGDDWLPPLPDRAASTTAAAAVSLAPNVRPPISLAPPVSLASFQGLKLVSSSRPRSCGQQGQLNRLLTWSWTQHRKIKNCQQLVVIVHMAV